MQCQEQTEAGIDYQVGAVGVTVFVDDPTAVAQAFAVGHVSGVGYPRSDQKQQGKHCADPDTAQCIPFGFFVSDQKQKANGIDRHLHHTGQIADVHERTDIPMLPGIHEMKQAESPNRQQEAEKAFFPPGGKEHRCRQHDQQAKPNHPRRRGSFVPCPVRQHVQAGLGGEQQHQPESGPPYSVIDSRQCSHLLPPGMEMASSDRRRHLTCTLTGAP